MFEARKQLITRGLLEHESSTDAAAERQKLITAKAICEPLVAGKDNAKKLASVEIPAREDAQLREDVGEHLLRLVENEDRARQRRRDVLVPSRAQRFEAGPAVVHL
ncbi:MAG TPA: hypothetical protein VGM39_01320 [Kofleriaceae bacterium]